VAALLRGHALAALLRCWALSNTNSRCKKISKPIHGRKHFFQVATPVQITVTVDSNGAVTGFQAVGNSGDAMGAKVVSAAEAAAIALSNQTKATLTGAAAVAALTPLLPRRGRQSLCLAVGRRWSEALPQRSWV
jgi:hypothetical protein